MIIFLEQHNTQCFIPDLISYLKTSVGGKNACLLENLFFFLQNLNIFTVGKVHLGLNLTVDLKSDHILLGVALRGNKQIKRHKGTNKRDQTRKIDGDRA